MPSSVPRTGPVRPATPTDVSAAIAERRRRERRRHLGLVGGGAALVLLLALALWLVSFSPVFASKQVLVEGNKLVSTDQVLTAAQVPMGIPLSKLKTGPIGQRVAVLPPVGGVRVHTKWPSTVVIEVTERVAVYQRLEGTTYQSVDAAGVVFVQGAKRNKSLPLVRTPSVENRLLADVATVVTNLTPKLVKKLDAVEASGPDDITVKLTTGQQVLWGSAADSATKAQVAEALVAREKFTVFNVASPANPTAR